MSPRTPAQVKKLLEPKETHIQQAVVRFLLGDLKGDRKPGIGMTDRYPELIDLYAIPNQGARDAANGARMKAEGLFKSIPDLCLPVPKGPFHGLYLEAKRPSGRSREDQTETQARLELRGYFVQEFRTAEEGITAIICYLELGEFYEPQLTSVRPMMTSLIRQAMDKAVETGKVVDIIRQRSV